MTKIGYYSVLRYVPSVVREEFMNIGLAFHYPHDCILEIKVTDSFSRLRKFDDEADIDLLRVILDGIKDEFDPFSPDGPNREQLCDETLLEKLTKPYVNQLQFSDIHGIVIQDPESDFDSLYKTYVYYEHPRSKRITEQQVHALLRRTFRQHNIMRVLQGNTTVRAKREEEIIRFDFGYRQREFIKVFAFDYSTNRSNKAPDTARIWAYNFIQLKSLSNNEHQFISVVHVRKRDRNINLALDILNEQSRIYFADEADKLATYFQDKVRKDDPQMALDLGI